MNQMMAPAVSSLGTRSLFLCVLCFACSITRAINVDFGTISIGEKVADKPVQLWNSSSVNEWNYTVETPQSPFALRSGNLSGNLHPLETANLIFSVTAPEDAVGLQRFTQILQVSEQSDITLTVLVVGHPAKVSADASAAFGRVFANYNKEIVIMVSNQTAVRIDGFIRQPAPPFYLLTSQSRVTETLQFALSPGDILPVKVAFAPKLINSDQSFERSLTVQPSTANTLPTTVSLTGFAVGPRPVNFEKIEVSPENFSFFDAIHNFLFGDGLGVNRLSTAVRFDSNTGKISDLQGLRIWEVLSFTGCPILTDMLPVRTIGCTDYTSRAGTKPRPWKPDAIFGVDEYPIEFTWASANNRGYFLDGHDIGKFNFPLVEGEYVAHQKYIWTMPWHRAEITGCLIPELALTDTITRTVASVGDDWIATIDSSRVGARSWDLNRLYFGDYKPIRPDGIKVEWFLDSSTLQAASTPNGPWSDVAGSKSVTGLTVNPSASRMFYRLKPRE